MNLPNFAVPRHVRALRAMAAPRYAEVPLTEVSMIVCASFLRRVHARAGARKGVRWGRQRSQTWGQRAKTIVSCYSVQGRD